MSHEILRYSAFTAEGRGGNPAGVVLDARGMDDAAMQAVAAGLGYSETAFLLPRDDAALDVRYFSPVAEVSFCGHATIAASIAHGERHGPGERLLHTPAGLVRVMVEKEADGFSATFASAVRPGSGRARLVPAASPAARRWRTWR